MKKIGRPPLRDQVFNALPGTEAEIRMKTGLGRTTVWRWIRVMLQAKEIHITNWNRLPNGGPFPPSYAQGRGRNAPLQLKPLAIATISANHRRRARANGTWEERLARQRRKYWADKVLRDGYQRDPLMSWIPVRPTNSHPKDA